MTHPIRCNLCSSFLKEAGSGDLTQPGRKLTLSSFRPSYRVKRRVEGRPWPAHPWPWTLSSAHHPGPGRRCRTYRIKIGEEVDCGRRVKRKWKKRFNVQRWLQRWGWRPDQGWESGALACATCTEEKRGHGQGPKAQELTAHSHPGLSETTMPAFRVTGESKTGREPTPKPATQQLRRWAEGAPSLLLSLLDQGYLPT